VKQLLAVSWEMPPLSGPRAVQVTRTLAALPEFGWQSRVVCFGPRSNRYQQDHHVSLEELSGGHASRIPVASPEEWLVFRVLWRLAPPLKRLPDEKRVWMPGALRAARAALDARRPDVLVSFAQPWSDHLIGLQLRRESALPWVAHFSDPWVDSPYFRAPAWARRRAERWEREVVGEATRIVFVSSRTRDRVMAKYPSAWMAKTDVIPQAYEPAAGGDVDPSRGLNRPMRMVYTGRFYDGLRTPDTLLEALATIHRTSPLSTQLEVELVGGAMASYQARAAALGLHDVVRFPGRVPPVEARARAATADVLLVIDAGDPAGSIFQPSKLIEYLPARRPIFGITPAVGPSADLLRELGYRAVEPNDVTGIAEGVRALLQLHAAGRLVASLQHDTVAARFSVAKTSRSFAAVLERAVSAR
jgi:glycosyltransferase involved in cell wall biosynthesis